MPKDPNSVTRVQVVADKLVERLIQRRGRHVAKRGVGLLAGLQLDKIANRTEQNRALQLLLDEKKVSVTEERNRLVLTLIES